MKKLFFLSLASLVAATLSLGGVSANVVNEVSCTPYMKYGVQSGDQCFLGKTTYLGSHRKIVDFKDYFTNLSNSPQFMYQTDMYGQPGFTAKFNSLNGAGWHIDDNGDFFELQGFKRLANTSYFMTGFKPGVQKLLVQSLPGKGIQLVKLAPNTQSKEPVGQFIYTTRHYNSYRDNSGALQVDTSKSFVHKEHLFFFAEWCGDGIVNGPEKFDDGANNGRPGYASTDCKTKNPPAPEPIHGYCDGASNGVPTETAPKNLCKSGTPSVVVEKNGKFTWTCGGVNGGANATCEAPKKVTPPPTPIIPEKCDQTFHDKLRLGWNYRLYDMYTNSNSYAHTLNNFIVKFQENHGDDMNKDGKFTYNNFEWVAPYKDGATIPAGAKDVKIIHANPAYSLLTPPKKRQKDNIYIEYIINGKGKENFSHKECITYEVTWCGDGVVDTDEGEICDPNDPNKKNWGSAGCNNVCQPQNAELQIKKFVKNKDSQTSASAEPVAQGEVFPYTFEVTNSGKTDIPSAKVVDVFPSELEVVKTGEGINWKCEQSGQTMSCLYSAAIKAGEKASTLTAQVRLKNTVADGTIIRNVAAVCVSDPSKPVNDPSQCKPNREICKPGDKNYDPNTKSCDPSTVKVESALKIKKFAGNRDGQISADALQVSPGGEFTYTYRVSVSGEKSQSKVTVTDTFPLGVEVIGFKDVPNNWSCNYAQKTEGKNIRSSVVCQTPEMKPNTTVNIVVKAKMFSNVNDIISEGSKTLGLRNIAYVCSTEVPGKTPSQETSNDNNKVCDPACTDPNNPNCVPKPPVQECSPIPEHPHYDPACVKVSDGLDLAIKKYVNTSDAQPGSAVTLDTNATFNYVIKVRVKSGTATGTTIVKDVLPEGVKIDATKISANGWTCNVDGKLLICTSTQVVEVGKFFSDIVVPATVTEITKGKEIPNHATVYNSNEKPSNACHKDGKEISGSEKNCENDPDNTDPAIIKTPGSTGGGGGYSDPYATVLCVNDIAILKEYVSLVACRAEWDAERDPKKKYSGGCIPKNNYSEYDKLRSPEVRAEIQKSCNTNPGGGGGGGWNGGGGGGWNPYCGDGIVNRPGEMCDLGSRNGGPACSSDCKVDPKTNPGANPISYKISIPTFSKVNLGGTTGAVEFSKNGMVIGKDSKIFSLGDTVLLNMTPTYNVPIHIAAGKDFTISQENLVGSAIPSNLEKYNSQSLPYWISRDGTKWYVIGKGDFLMPKTATNYQFITCTQEGSQFRLCNIDAGKVQFALNLFKGSELQGFVGYNPTENGQIHLNAISDDGRTSFSLASFPVTVLNSRVSVNGMYRKLQNFTNYNWSGTYLDSLKKNSQTTVTTPAKDDLFAENAFKNNLENQAFKTGNVTATTVADLENYKLNGNPNVYAVKGNVTLTCGANQTFQLSGVKTLLVDGNLTIDCDTSYADANASWAFIVKGGDIIVNKKVKNISGVIVAATSEIKQNETTADILRIDGTLYGKADNLFNKRTYARGTSSYEILTTGTVITYSNRALRNPPPLLAQYLNTYKVQRVVR